MDEFVDFYELMQISSNAEQETLQRVYRMLASRYHPDNKRTGDIDKFLQLNQAYKILSNPTTRAAYDAQYPINRATPLKVFEMKEFAAGIDGEANRRMGLLCLLYTRRRTNPEHSGLSILELENLMSFPREHLMFTIWYLREKEYIRQAEGSDFVIGAAGVDYVESHLPSNRILYSLLKAAEKGVGHTAGDEIPDLETMPEPVATAVGGKEK
jgi:curved DNA-binding protein CbpA